MLREMTDRAWFSRLVRHPARKRSGSILTTLEPARGLISTKAVTMSGDDVAHRSKESDILLGQRQRQREREREREKAAANSVVDVPTLSQYGFDSSTFHDACHQSFRYRPRLSSRLA